MYQSYKRELWTYTGESYEDQLRGWFDDMFSNNAITVHPVTNAHTRALIGFFVTQELNRDQQIESGCKWYINESYILPSHRNQGYMTAIVHEYATRHSGNIGLVTIDNNKKAIKFWEDTFQAFGYKEEMFPNFWNEGETFYKFSKSG